MATSVAIAGVCFFRQGTSPRQSKLTRPSPMTDTAWREDFLAHARDLFEVLEKKAVTDTTGQTYA